MPAAAQPERAKPKLAVLGGSGDLGFGLTLRWARAGYALAIGSRSLAKAQDTLAKLREQLSAMQVDSQSVALSAHENAEAARAADIVALCVPFAHHEQTLKSLRPALQGRILIDVTVPLVPPKVGTVQLPPEGSAGQRAQRILGPEVRVVSAFQNVAAVHLREVGRVECDVLVSGDDLDARAQVIALAEALGMRGLHAGPIANAAAAEALTSVLITLNRRHKCHAGILISGIQGERPSE